ncbi:uncharacterized protein METZ01_LOCUS378638, partial [marine metagenome]
ILEKYGSIKKSNIKCMISLTQIYINQVRNILGGDI